MALVVLGVTKCGYCGEVITREDVYAFPPFVANAHDPLWKFNDGVAHYTCLRKDPEGRQAIERCEAMLSARPLIKKVCVHCQLPILNPDDWLGFVNLTPDQNDPLYRYNDVELHKACLPHWAELRRAHRDFEHARASGRWAGPAINRLIAALAAGVQEA